MFRVISFMLLVSIGLNVYAINAKDALRLLNDTERPNEKMAVIQYYSGAYSGTYIQTCLNRGVPVSDRLFHKTFTADIIQTEINTWITSTIREVPDATLGQVNGVDIAQIAAERIGGYCLIEEILVSTHFTQWRSSCRKEGENICGAVQYMKIFRK